MYKEGKMHFDRVPKVADCATPVFFYRSVYRTSDVGRVRPTIDSLKHYLDRFGLESYEFPLSWFDTMFVKICFWFLLLLLFR